MKLVRILWLDSYGCSPDWRDLKTVVATDLHCESVGWLLHDGDECKVIVPHLTNPHEAISDQQGCGDMTIPVPSILKITELMNCEGPELYCKGDSHAQE